jgi:hypothetical protein
MRTRTLAALVLAVLAVPWLPAQTAPNPASPAPRKAARSGHPGGVDAAEDCALCHAEVTPELHRRWFDSKHGLNNVKCTVCHGSAGADFRRRPDAARCRGCHADQAETLKQPFFKGKDCFACHAGHSLNPHAEADLAPAAARPR